MAARKAKAMNATSGRLSSPSSASSRLQSSLESRLRRRLDGAGSTLFSQVADAIGWGWLDEASWDLEGKGYACAAAVLRASGFNARHHRKRLYWVADAGRPGREGHHQIDGVSVPATSALALYGDPFADAGRALDGDYRGVLPGDGLPVGVERLRAKGYGNAIVPQVAAEFIAAWMEAA
jgi:DNA (cytosine-5)-methyltransferase 1